jgi:hypothetical protein
MHSWGKGREFAVRDKTFTFDNADEKHSNARLVGFTKSLDIDGARTLIITIRSDGQNTTQETKGANR